MPAGKGWWIFWIVVSILVIAPVIFAIILFAPTSWEQVK